MAIAVFCLALFRTVAMTNVAVLGLILVAPFAWRKFYKDKQEIDPSARWFLWLVTALCAWDVITNLAAGYALDLSLQASWHDMRTLFFIVLFWPIFANSYVARFAFVTISVCVVAWAGTNLLLTLIGVVPQGRYFCEQCSHLSHMYGQALVGVFFLLAQIFLLRPKFTWRILIPMALLVLSLFLASERRTGYILLLVGLFVWGLLNWRRFNVGKYKWWFLLGALAIVLAAVSSGVVHRRMVQAVQEVSEYLAMSPQDRAGAMGATRIRLQYVNTVIEIIRQSNWWIGIGSLDLPSAYQAQAIKMGVEPGTFAWSKYNWSNPHNEYIFMLVTKGVIGLVLYLAIFAQACHVAWRKNDEVQRIGLLMFVFLFMLSITTNSMVIDMEEGHFMMLILLIFLAPNSLSLFAQKKSA